MEDIGFEHRHPASKHHIILCLPQKTISDRSHKQKLEHETLTFRKLYVFQQEWNQSCAWESGGSQGRLQITVTMGHLRESYDKESRKIVQKVTTTCQVRGSVRSEIKLINED